MITRLLCQRLFRRKLSAYHFNGVVDKVVIGGIYPCLTECDHISKIRVNKVTDLMFLHLWWYIHVLVIKPTLRHSDAIWRHKPGLTLVQVTACCLLDAKLLLESVNIWSTGRYFSPTSQISQRIFRKGPIDNKTLLFNKVVTSYRTADRLLAEAVVIRVTWWRHQMETFPRYWSFVRGIHRSPVNSLHDRWIPCTKASDAELWCFLLSAPE